MDQEVTSRLWWPQKMYTWAIYLDKFWGKLWPDLWGPLNRQVWEGVWGQSEHNWGPRQPVRWFVFKKSTTMTDGKRSISFTLMLAGTREIYYNYLSRLVWESYFLSSLVRVAVKWAKLCPSASSFGLCIPVSFSVSLKKSSNCYREEEAQGPGLVGGRGLISKRIKDLLHPEW